MPNSGHEIIHDKAIGAPARMSKLIKHETQLRNKKEEHACSLVKVSLFFVDTRCVCVCVCVRVCVARVYKHMDMHYWAG